MTTHMADLFLEDLVSASQQTVDEKVQSLNNDFLDVTEGERIYTLRGSSPLFSKVLGNIVIKSLTNSRYISENRKHHFYPVVEGYKDLGNAGTRSERLKLLVKVPSYASYMTTDLGCWVPPYEFMAKVATISYPRQDVNWADESLPTLAPTAPKIFITESLVLLTFPMTDRVEVFGPHWSPPWYSYVGASFFHDRLNIRRLL